MKTKFPLTGMEPRQAICMAIIISLCVYFAADVSLLISKLDFTTENLGTSESSDFFVFYAGARFLLDGAPLTSLYDPAVLKSYQISLGAEAGFVHPFTYPPSYALLIEPLGFLPHAWARIIWTAGTLALFAASLRLAGLRWIEVLAAGVAPASVINIAAGQNGFLTSALLIAGMALLTRRPGVSGAIFGILTLKPHLGLLVPVVTLAERRWPAIVAAVAVTLGSIAVSTLVLGGDAWLGYLESLQWFQATAANQAGDSFFKLSATALMAAKILSLPDALAYLLQGALSAFALGTVYWAYRRRADPDLLLTLMLTGTAIATPYAFLYDLPFVAVAVVLSLRHALRGEFLPYESLAVLFVFLAPFMGAFLNTHGLPLVPLAHLIFFGYILARLRAGSTPRPCTGI